MSAIHVRQISKAFEGVPAVRGVSFSAEQGQFTVLLGPSGCGKSTTLRLIAGIERADSGAIEIGGRDVTNLPPDQRHISMVFQSYALFPHLNAAENIVFGLKVRGVARGERDERLARVAALTGLTKYLDRKPSQLSGGQRQRVALARAIIAEQPVCLMDEPLSNLDAQLRHEMRVEIRALQQRLGITMVDVTHDQIEAMTMSDRIVLLKDGVIEQQGSPEDLYERPASTFVARFIGAPAMNLLPADGVVRGVRPECVGIAGHAAPAGHVSCEATVAALEYLGADTIISARVGDATMVARVAGRAAAQAGSPVLLHWRPEDEHRFDAASGMRQDMPVRRAPELESVNS